MKIKRKPSDEPLAEYDFRGGRRGRYAGQFASGTNLVALEPDIAEVFDTSVAVNNALRKLIQNESANSPSSTRKADVIYIERSQTGNYVVSSGKTARLRAVAPTQSEAISRARQLSPDTPIYVARVRRTSGSHDKWRKP
jgi:hypothetical protein